MESKKIAFFIGDVTTPASLFTRGCRGAAWLAGSLRDPAIQPRVSPYMKTGVITGTPSVFPIVAGLASAAPIVSMRAVRDWHIWNRR